MDAQRRQVPAVARLAAGERLDNKSLARLQRGDDLVSVGDRLADAPDLVRGLVRVGANMDLLRRVSLSCGCFTPFYTSIFPRVGRFPQ